MSERLAAGSLRYFAVLFAAPAARAVLEALYSFEGELRRVSAGASHEAAHARLGWWRGEVDRLAAGRPEHPIAIALLPLRSYRDADPTLLHEMLVAADLDLARMTYRTWPELEAYCFRAAGALHTLLAATLAGDRALTTTEREFARRLGSAVRQVEMLRDLHVDLAEGRFYAPLEPLNIAGVTPSDLKEDAASPAAERFLAAWSARLAGELAGLPELLPDAAERARQRHGLVLGALHRRLLARGEPGPLNRLWIAWRTALRYA
jgi:phytoene synthase